MTGELADSEQGNVPRTRRTTPARIADAVVLGVLALVMLLQDPGRIRFDTKLDLVVDPWGFLARAFSAWDPTAGFGQLQNQAYGYLFPMGPFFGVAHSLGVPPWITQALWAWLLLGTAYLGVRVLCSRLGMPWYAAVVGGLAYALAPRLVTVIGPLSAEALPAALLPWTIVPLVTGGRTVRRTAFLAAVPVLLMGAANATLTLAVLPVTAIWILTRSSGRWRLLAWWSAFVAMFCLWWVVPLLVQARYATPFLTFIETGRDTTYGLTPSEVLRGDVHWVAGIVDHGLPWWPAGYQYVATAWVIVGTLLLAAVGLGGLASRRMPERLASGVVAAVGLVVMSAGSFLSPVAPLTWALLDGPLSPFRNVHKFDPLLRLPLALGVAWAVVVVGALLADLGRRHRASSDAIRWGRAVPAVAIVILVAAVGSPLALPGVAAGRTWSQIPDWWTQTATWLESQPDSGRALVVPGSGFGQYLWGRTIDEPLQPLASSPWAIDNGLPLGSIGSARVLDSVSAALREGREVPGLADTLARTGISYVVVRNDLDVDRTSAPARSVVAATLQASSGLELATTFGEPLESDLTITTGNFDRDGQRPVIEIYRVAGPVVRVDATELATVGVMSGGPESLLPAAAAGILGRSTPVVFGDDAPPSGLGGPQVLTDGLMRRDRALGRGDESLSSVLTADEPSRLRRRSPDLVPFADPSFTVASFRGVAMVSASSSRSYADSYGELLTERQPFAGVDGDIGTWWQSGSFGGPVGEWLQVDLRAPTDARGLVVRMVSSDLVGSRVTTVELSTATARWTEPVSTEGVVGPVLSQDLSSVTSVRITAVEAVGDRGDLGVREVEIPGVDAAMPLLTPVPPSSDGRAVSMVLAARSPLLPTCVQVDDEVRCDPVGARADADAGVLDRLVTVHDEASGRLSLTGLVRAGPSAAALFDPVGSGIRVRASTWLGSDVRVRPSAAVDGDPTTRWVAGLYDVQPHLDLSWGEPRTVTSIRLGPTPAGQLFADPLAVTVSVGGRTVAGDVGPGGTLALPPTRATSLRITITRASPVASVDGSTGFVTPAPVSIAEVEVGGLGDLVYRPDLTASTGAVCGLGPTLGIDGIASRTSVRTTLRDVLAGAEAVVEPCGRVAATLAPGTHRIVVRGTALVDPLRLSLRAFGPSVDPVTRSIQVAGWGESDREVTVAGGGQAVLRVAESANPGWVADLEGTALVPVRVDGWQQGWLLPAGAGGTVHLHYGPSRAQVLGLLLGAVVALLGLLLGLFGRGGSVAWSHRPARGLPPLLVAATVTVVGVALLGLPGLVAGLAATVLARRRVAPVIAFVVTALAAAGVAYGWSALAVSGLSLAGTFVAVAAAVSRRRGR